MRALLGRIKRKVLGQSLYPTGPFTCPLCKTENLSFLPLPIEWFRELQKYQYVHNIFFCETVNLADYMCPCCGAADRDRLYALYLSEHFNGRTQTALLDIAPSNELARFMRSFPSVQYRSMDLYMKEVDDNLDITDMHLYKEGQYDFVVCSHVLEHIPDDVQAMREIYRILKHGGKAIMMVPINLILETTMEDPAFTSIGDRWKYFGQDDHVRQYAKKDFLDRLESVGFTVDQLDINHFGEQVFEKAGIYPTSVLYIANK